MIALVALLLAGPLTLRYDDADIGEVLRDVAVRAEAKIALDDEFAGKKITLDVEEWQLPEVLEEIAKQAGGEVFAEPGGPFRIVPAWKHVLLKRLYATRVKLHTDDATPLVNVLQTFRELTGVPVVLDPVRTEWPEVALNADQVSGAQFLGLVTAPHELVWELRYGVVFVSTRARMEEIPARLDVSGAPDKRIALTFEKASWPQVAQVIVLMAGLKVEGELPKEGTVTLDVASIEVRHALELLFAPHGLSVTIADGKAFVATWIPYPKAFPELKKEAQAIERARTLKSKEELDKASAEAMERLDEAFNETFDQPEGGWYLLYLGHWQALRATRVDPKELAVALDYFKTIEETLGDGEDANPDARLIVRSARAERKRLEAASK